MIESLLSAILLSLALVRIFILEHKLKAEKKRNAELLVVLEGIVKEFSGSSKHDGYTRVFAYDKPFHLKAIKILAMHGKVSDIRETANSINGKMAQVAG